MVNDIVLNEAISLKEKRLNIRISKSYHRKISQLKKRIGISYSEMVRRGLAIYIDKYDY